MSEPVWLEPGVIYVRENHPYAYAERMSELVDMERPAVHEELLAWVAEAWGLGALPDHAADLASSEEEEDELNELHAVALFFARTADEAREIDQALS